MKATAIFAACSALVLSASAQTILVDFDTDADYDENFVEIVAGNPSTSRDAGGYLLKPALADASATSTVAIYDTGATGALSAGAGGTTFSGARDTFGGTAGAGNFTIQADIYYDISLGNTGTSFGFYTKVPTGQTTGYAGLFRIMSTTSTDFRLFDSNGNPGTGAVGTQIGSTQTISGLAAGTFSLDTFYTIKLAVVDVGSNVEFTGSIYTQGGSLITTFTTLSDTTSAVLGAGQVGFRISNSTINNNVRLDNFGISVVPEPCTFGFLLGGASLLALRRRRA